MKRSAGRVTVMTFDLGTQVAVGLRLPTSDETRVCYPAMREPVEPPCRPPEVRAAVRRLVPKFRAFLENRYAR